MTVSTVPAAWELDRQSIIDRLRQVRTALYSTGTIEGDGNTDFDLWPTGVGEARGAALGRIVARENATSCIETGFAFGLSASYLLEACLSNPSMTSRPESSVVVSIDPFAASHWKNAGIRFLESFGSGDLHRLVVNSSELALPGLCRDGRRFDVAFIDGDHRFEYVFLDIFYCRRLVRDEGLIIVDDAWMPAVKKVVAFFANADLCGVEPSTDSEENAFVQLRATGNGDSRPWDHFSEF